MATKRKTSKEKPAAMVHPAAQAVVGATQVTVEASDTKAVIETVNEGEDPVAIVGLEKLSLKKPVRIVPETKESANTAAALWDRIKDQPIDIFALPNQTVSNHVIRHEALEKATPYELHFTLRSDAVLPALEDALSRVRLKSTEQFDISQVARYTVVKVVPRVR